MNELASVLAAFYDATQCEAGVWMQLGSTDASPTNSPVCASVPRLRNDAIAAANPFGWPEHSIATSTPSPPGRGERHDGVSARVRR